MRTTAISNTSGISNKSFSDEMRKINRGMSQIGNNQRKMMAQIAGRSKKGRHDMSC